MRLQLLTGMLEWHTHAQRYALFMVLTLLHMATTTYSTRMHNIHWNASNPLFRRDKHDNIIEINGGNHPWEYDQVNIVCPVYKPGTNTDSSQEEYIIYSVTKQEYDSCRITQPNPKIIAVCNRPHELMYFTITFRSFTPTPGGLEFRPGHSYYFISTSSKNDLHRRVGGGCSTNNMKVTFHVAEDKHEASGSKSTSLPFAASSTVRSPIVPRQFDNNKQQTFYYPTSEVEQAEFYHHQRRHNQEEQAPWLASSSSLPLANCVVMAVLQLIVLRNL